MMPQLAFVAVTVATGWAALWPLRSRVGAAGYHLAAFPTGLLGWGLVATAALALRTGYSWLLAGTVLIAFAAAFFALARHALRAEEPGTRPLPAWTFAAWALVLGAFTGAMASWGISVFSHDGWAQYELYSWPLFDTGAGSLVMLGQRMLLPPAFHAAYHLFGGEFAGFVYPVLSLHVAVLVGAVTARAARAAGRWTALALTAVVVTAMVAHVTYLFMSIYVHSHTISALYLLLAGAGIMYAHESAQRAGHGAPLSPAWLLVAGTGVAGIFLSRPDGPAYAMAAVLLGGYALVSARADRRGISMLFAPVVVLAGAYTMATIINQGIWTTPKIGAGTLIGFTVLYAVIWALLRFVPFSRLDWLATGTNTLALLVAVESIALVWLFRVLGEQANTTIFTMMTNLLEQGGWRSFWPLITAMVIVSVVLSPREGRHPFTTALLFYAAQFFVIAFAVHGVTHPGRLGWGDSFNRVAFHSVPLIFAYLGVYAAGLTRTLGAGKTRTET